MKQQVSADEIRAEIRRRIRASPVHGGNCRDCAAPVPRAIDPAANGGCNWTVDVFPGMLPGCFDVVWSLTREVMAEYDLTKET
jgi:hypothetical protein